MASEDLEYTSVTIYSAGLAWWYSTMPGTTAIDVFWVFVILDVIWFLGVMLRRRLAK